MYVYIYKYIHIWALAIPDHVPDRDHSIYIYENDLYH